MTKAHKEPSLIEELQFEGSEIVIGKKTYIMPPLPITKLHKTGFFKLMKDFQNVSTSSDPEILMENYMKILEFIFLALKMNYPDITEAETIDLLDMRSANAIIPYITDTKPAIEQAEKNV